MEINNNIQRVLREYVREVDSKSAAIESEAKQKQVKDTIELSSDRKDVERAREEIKNLPDSRADEVKKIKSEIKEGTYNPSAQQIAERIVSHYIIDTLA